MVDGADVDSMAFRLTNSLTGFVLVGDEFFN
jgi:hypothetical protein